MEKTEQPAKINISDNLHFIKYYPYYKRTLQWYSDKDVCKQVDNIDHVYSLDDLKRMYKFLSSAGECYYIKYFDEDKKKWRLIGDVSLWNGEIAVVICKEYQNHRIGRDVIYGILKRAKELGYNKVIANIYDFNIQSRKCFEAVGFKNIGGDVYEIEL